MTTNHNLGSYLLITVLICVSNAWAHWETESPAFPWATPGQMRWLINYSTMDEPQIKAFLDADFNVIQGGGFTPAAIQLLATRPDLRAMQYICSRTIYHDKLFISNPELKDAAILNPDGSYKIIYNNPARYAGCWNREPWLNYIKARMDDIAARGLKCIFFDNPMTWPCYCPTCQQLFTEFAKEKNGQELKLGQFGNPTELEYWFTLETAVRFWKNVHSYAREKGLFIVANNMTYWLVNQGLTDGVFTEGWGHAPFQQDIAAYKIGLAASHGKPTGVLDYIPVPVRKARGGEAFNASQGSGTKWVGAPIAEEYEVAYWQGLACGGNFLPNYSLELGRRVDLFKTPEDLRIQAVLTKCNRFAKSHPAVYAKAKPGASVAVLYDLESGPREGEILGINRGKANSTLWTFINAGIPVDLIVADDLTPERLAGIKAIVVNDVSILEPTTASALASFAKSGGTVLFAAPGKVRGRFDPPGKAVPLSQWFPGLPLINSYHYGLNDFTLTGYEVTPPYLKLTTEGTASVTFQGAAGDYRIAVSYLDEDDGQGGFEVLVDGKEVARWRNDADDNQEHTYSTGAVNLKPGQTIKIVGHAGGGEYGRITRMRVDSFAGKEGSRFSPVGRGQVWQTGQPLTDTDGPTLKQIAQRLRPLSPVRSADAAWPTKLLLNLTNTSAQGPLYAHLVNYNYRYDDKFNLQAIEPGGPVTLEALGCKSAKLLSPDGVEQQLTITNGKVRIPTVHIYAVVELR